jgi:hypothetical protein
MKKYIYKVIFLISGLAVSLNVFAQALSGEANFFTSLYTGLCIGQINNKIRLPIVWHIRLFIFGRFPVRSKKMMFTLTTGASEKPQYR